MVKKRQSNRPFPRMAFSSCGDKLTKAQLSTISYVLELPKELQRFLLWRNGGTPLNRYFDWHQKDQGAQVGRVDSFFRFDATSQNSGKHSCDCVWAILKCRYWLPRWSIPMGFANNDDFLITFCNYDERAGQVWLKSWCHDIPDDEIGVDDETYFVADSIVSFVHALRKEE